MIKSDFDKAVLDRLRQVPIENRRNWKEHDLMTWWNAQTNQDSYLTLDRCKGDVWQHVNGLSMSLFGPKAF